MSEVRDDFSGPVAAAIVVDWKVLVVNFLLWQADKSYD